jgi:hypothetical protein
MNVLEDARRKVYGYTRESNRKQSIGGYTRESNSRGGGRTVGVEYFGFVSDDFDDE